MNIGLIGSGGREHSLCRKIYESKIVKKIICFPGNAGTAKLAKNIDVNILDFKKAELNNFLEIFSIFSFSNFFKLALSATKYLNSFLISILVIISFCML